MKFKLEIELGNDAMDNPHDIAAALRDLADKLDVYGVGGSFGRVKHPDGAKILDFNGNSVGSWEVL